MKCAYCEHNDGMVYTSLPPQYRCTITNEFHLGSDDCNVEFAPVKHGQWIKITQEWVDDAEYLCSCCGRKIKAPYVLNPAWAFPYCHCGAKMDAQIGEDKSHPFAESVMMGMDGGENG